MSEETKELRDLVHQVEAQLLATHTAIRSILTASPGLVPTVTEELERVRVAPPGRVVTDSVFGAMDRAIRRMLPADPTQEAPAAAVGDIKV